MAITLESEATGIESIVGDNYPKYRKLAESGEFNKIPVGIKTGEYYNDGGEKFDIVTFGIRDYFIRKYGDESEDNKMVDNDKRR